MSKAHHDPEFAARQDVPMKVRLGNLTIVVSVLFGLGLLVSMGRAAWHPPSWENSLIAFFAFGIPMVVLGVATYALWERKDELKVKFGWVCVAGGLIWALALFGFIAEWVRIISLRAEPITFFEGAVLFLGFAIPTLVCGTPGIALVMESDK